MVRKYDDGITRTFYLSREVLERARLKCARLGIPLSGLVNDLLEKWASAEDADPEVKYEELKRQYVKLVQESKRLSTLLQALGAQEELKNFLRSWA